MCSEHGGPIVLDLLFDHTSTVSSRGYKLEVPWVRADPLEQAHLWHSGVEPWVHHSLLRVSPQGILLADQGLQVTIAGPDQPLTLFSSTQGC